MGILRRMVGLLGLSKDEAHDEDEDGSYAPADAGNVNRVPASAPQTNIPRKGFSVPAQVAVERAQHGPLIFPCNGGDGSVQGFRWYARRLRIDEDGDVADEFLTEVVQVTLSSGTQDHRKPSPRFEVNYSTKPAKVRSQTLSDDGEIRHGVEYQARLLRV